MLYYSLELYKNNWHKAEILKISRLQFQL